MDEPLPQPKLSPHVNSSSESSASSPTANKKSRSVGTDRTGDHVDRASISMPPPAITSRQQAQQEQQHQQHQPYPTWKPSNGNNRRASTATTAVDKSPVSSFKSKGDPDITPTLEAGLMTPNSQPFMLPEAALRPAKPHDPDTESNRLSFSSLYSFGSAIVNGARGIASSGASSVAGSESDVRFDATHHGHGIATSPVAAAHPVPHGPLGHSTQNATPIEQAGSAPNPNTGRTMLHVSPSSQSLQWASSPTTRHSQNQPVQRSRSRTRTQRRISGSTVATSASPGSERPNTRDSTERKRPTYGVIGVCALDTKARSKPSRNILNRLIANGEFDVIIFGDKIILDEDVENWPVCDFLISFFSDGFPLQKAIAYAHLRKPFCVNDLPMQTVLWDRRVCLRILDSMSVLTPKRIEVNRDGGPTLPSPELAVQIYENTGLRLQAAEDGTGGTTKPPTKVELLEDGDVLSVDGVQLKKPFVEKPVSGEDHNIHIYYPKSLGGGGRRLFRKVNNKSSERDESLNIPRAITEPQNSYIYEQFLRVDSAEDVKAYTVGPNFCHAETRKSPVVDGLVKRNPNGKEIRYITKLTKGEAEIASRIVNAFGQRVCGFDLLRAGGRSYVIDVNGWSFVKDNNEYYDKCTSILRELFIREKQRLEGRLPPTPESEDISIEKTLAQRRQSSHRHALKSLFQSPSMSKLTGNHNILHRHGHGHGHSPPDTLPLDSTPSMENTLGMKLPLSGSHPTLILPTVINDASSDSTRGRDSSVVRSSRSPVPAPASKAQWKLKGMVSVIRHADRTPKQKFKFTFHTKPFVDLLKGHQEEVLLIGEAALNSVLDAVNIAIQEGREDPGKLKLLQTSLIKKGGWAGTKVQIKPMFRSQKEDGSIKPLTERTPSQVTAKQNYLPEEQESPKVVGIRHDSAPDITLSRIAAAEKNLILDKLQLIIKWGGEPTHSARYQAQDLGENLRNDLLLMNRECLEDVACFSSSERRVTTSAQIFAAAFLDQKDLPEHFITVRKDLLDDSNAAKDEMDKVKKKLKQLLREGDAAPPEFAWPKGAPEPFLVARRVVELMRFHRNVMRYNFSRLHSQAASSLAAVIKPFGSDTAVSAAAVPPGSKSQAQTIVTIQPRWCSGEDAELFRERWEKLFREFVDAEKVDPSKISELYDTMKFDALHNRQFLEWIFTPDPSMMEEATVSEQASPLLAAGEASESIKSSRRPSDAKEELDKSDSKEKEKSNLAQRIRFKSRSDPEKFSQGSGNPSTGSSSTKSTENIPESYFKLYTGKGSFSPSKVKVDVRLTYLRELYKLSKTLFDYIGPQEYGISPDEKLSIGLLTSLPLLKEIVMDLEEMQASESGKSFFYFTKESHIYTLMNCILEGGVKTKIARKNIPELDYLSHINFELYESQNMTIDDGDMEFNYSIRISISPGCHTFDPLDVELDSKHCIGCAPRRSLTDHQDWREILETLRAKFHTVKLPKSFIAINLSETIPDAFSMSPVSFEAKGEGEGEGETEEEPKDASEKPVDIFPAGSFSES